MSIGENIKNIRKSKGITQKELAEKIGITDSAITKYEKGDREPNIETLNKIAEALGVTINDLLNKDEKQTLIVNDIFNVLKNMAESKPIEVYQNGRLNFLIKLSESCNKETQVKFNEIINKFPNLNPLPNEYKINEPLYNELDAEFIQPLFDKIIEAFEKQLDINTKKYKTQLKNYAEWWNSLSIEERNAINKKNEKKRIEEKKKKIQDIVMDIAFDIDSSKKSFGYLSYFLRKDSTCNYDKCKIMYDFLAEQLKLFIDNTNKLKNEEDK